jgi:hypothetical protein
MGRLLKHLIMIFFIVIAVNTIFKPVKNSDYQQGYEDGKQFILDALQLEDSLSKINTLQPYMMGAIKEMEGRRK